MSHWVSRSAWGARPPSGSGNTLSATPKGHAIHWEGPEMGVPDHTACDDTVRSIQAYHMDQQDWSDIAYNILVCQHGYQYEGRGKGKGSAANGNSQANKDWYAICALCGQGDPAVRRTDPGVAGRRRHMPFVGRRRGVHRPPGPHSDRVPRGRVVRPRGGRGVHLRGFGRRALADARPREDRDAPTYPLPTSHYYGPAEGPAQSHSGYYSQEDRDNLADWQTRMEERGWTITADGYYGPETDGVATQFQQEKGLDVDGLIGPDTWGAAWTEPVT